MDIKVNIENVRELANRIRAGANLPEFKQHHAYESLAHLAGHKNWDTLNGLLQAEEKARQERLLLAGTGFTVFVPAFSCSEFGESPDWARIRFSQGLTRRILGLQDLVDTNALGLVTISYGVDYWHDTSDLRITAEDLYVSERSVWFRGVPKHCGYAVETRAFDFQEALEVVRTGKATEYMGMHQGNLVISPYGGLESFIHELEDDEAFGPEDSNTEG